MKYAQECCGSILEIDILDGEVSAAVLQQCFDAAHNFEKKYSRFIRGNILDSINSEKTGSLPAEIISLLALCLKVSKLTKGHFDITLQPLLENHGYGIHDAPMEESIGYQNIELNNNYITLRKGVCIEFGSFGKGYILDLIYNMLSKHSENFVINFGGDIRICGMQEVRLEDPYDTKKYIGSLQIYNCAIASSSGNRRNFGIQHHLQNPYTKSAQDDKIAVYITHPLGVFADIFSTALFVTPLQQSLDLLEQIDNLEALIISSEGKIHKTKNFDVTLSI